MKLVRSGSLHFNTKSKAKHLVSFEVAGFRVEFDAEKLKDNLQGPIAFVFNQHNNAWAHDFMSAFKNAVGDWMEDGKAPDFDHILTTESDSELAAKIVTHPFFARNAKKRALLLTVGNVASAEVCRVRYAYSRSDIPQLFCVTGDPEKLELTYEGRLLPNTNGIYMTGARTVKSQIRSLKSVSKAVKTVAIVSGVRHGSDLAYAETEAEAEKLAIECAKNGMRTIRLHLADGMDVVGGLTPLAALFDAIITLRDDTVYSLAREIAAFCDKNKIVHFACDLSSVAHGAAIGFGTSAVAHVPVLIDLIRRSASLHKPLHQLGLAVAEEQVVMHKNVSSILKQVRDLTQEKIDLLSMRDIQATY